MSVFIGNTIAANGMRVLMPDDTRLNRMDFQPLQEMADIWAIAIAPFTTDWWPGAAGITVDFAVSAGILSAVKWGEYDQAAGASSRYGFKGKSRDQYGSAVGICNMTLFKTSDDSVMDRTTSDPNGDFLLNTPFYPDTHQIRLHKAGSPDIDGVTVNTLIGT